MTIHELLPAIDSLSQAEKIQLAQIILQQLAAEAAMTNPKGNDFDPRQFFGLAQQTQKSIDDYLASAREGFS